MFKNYVIRICLNFRYKFTLKNQTQVIVLQMNYHLANIFFQNY